ncbi:VOC family protein [Luteitalea sp.]|jgi:PhnB protein
MTDTTYRTVNLYLMLDDANAEVTFLEAGLGGTVRQIDRTPDGRVTHGEVAIGDSVVMVSQASEKWPATRSAIYLWVDDVDARFAQARAAGGRVESEPADMPYGHRHGGIIDPNGNTWWIASPVRSSAP